jgi:hypothetical protein
LTGVPLRGTDTGAAKQGLKVRGRGMTLGLRPGRRSTGQVSSKLESVQLYRELSEAIEDDVAQSGEAMPSFSSSALR